LIILDPPPDKKLPQEGMETSVTESAVLVAEILLEDLE
jgi:hypothetical protein